MDADERKTLTETNEARRRAMRDLSTARMANGFSKVVATKLH